MVDDIIEIVKPDRLNIERFPSLAVDKHGKTGHHVHEGYQIKTTSGEGKSLLIFDVEQLIKDIEVPPEGKKHFDIEEV